MNIQSKQTSTWPNVVGAICIVFGGLSLFGSCLGFLGMSEIEQLHTAIPFGKGELDDSFLLQLQVAGPAIWLIRLFQILSMLLSLFLLYQGMLLLQRDSRAIFCLFCWSYSSIILSILSLILNWIPRWSLIATNSEIKGMFLAHLLISLPIALLLPVFLLIFLNKRHIKTEVVQWR